MVMINIINIFKEPKPSDILSIPIIVVKLDRVKGRKFPLLGDKVTHRFIFLRLLRKKV